tara:strand:+ start:469 stop:2190 length:1722 start_codon:yes stop_codon:yes gene_type:complete
MPEDTSNEESNAEEIIKCDICDAVVSGEVHSCDDYETVCGDCYEDLIVCDFCNIRCDTGNTTIAGETICDSCSSDCHCCVGCEQLISLGRHDYYENPNDYQYCCHNCSRETDMLSCNDCGNCVYYSEIGEDWAENEQCYDCYNSQGQSIEDFINSASITADKVTLTKHYDAAPQSVMQFYYNFYDGNAENMEHNESILQKSGGGYGKGYGYYNTSIEIASDTVIKMTSHCYNFIRSKRLYCDHRKFGIYNPFVDFFSAAIKFINEDTGDYLNGSDLSMEELGKNFNRYSISTIDKRLIRKMLEDDLKDKNELRHKITKAINGSFGKRLPLKIFNDDTFWGQFEKYKTNSAASKLKVRIGFDAKDMMPLLQFNRDVGSCQIRTNQESYAFGMMDMLTNPHLLYLIYEGDKIIGRAVIRLFKDTDGDITYVAPSRLYLTKFTHVKSTLYHSMFSAVNEWANMNFGSDKVKMIAYTKSRHDSASVYEYLDINLWNQMPTPESATTLQTSWWHQWWLEKPSNDEAEFIYYKDEDMISEYSRVIATDSHNITENYNTASREVLNSRHFYIIEEKTQNE